jgi:MATE family multidrug resistance protein
MAGSLIAYTAWREWKTSAGPFRARWSIDAARIRDILSLGFPAAAQIGLEVAAFSLATVLAGTLSTVAVAAHQVALNTAGLSFMVPLGISSAGAVRVGQAAGARDPERVRRSGWTALALGAGFMLSAGLAFVAIPRAILGVYTGDATVIAIGVILLYVAAVFQLFDGLQVVATGVLRGLGDTRTPMLANLAGHWFLGLPAGYLLCFHTGLGVIGLWVGLSVGLIAVAVALVIAWRRRSVAFVAV